MIRQWIDRSFREIGGGSKTKQPKGGTFILAREFPSILQLINNYELKDGMLRLEALSSRHYSLSLPFLEKRGGGMGALLALKESSGGQKMELL